MNNDLKKEQIKKILDSIKESAFSLIDMGMTNKHAMDIVMELTITAYELDLFTDFVNRSTKQTLPDNVIRFNPKDGQ